MALRLEVPASAISTEIELPITIGVGDVLNSVGTLTLQVRNGKVEDFRLALAGALREAADAVERASLNEDSEEAKDATPE